jgi:hypothetical protein
MKLAYLSDIPEKLNALNICLQGGVSVLQIWTVAEKNRKWICRDIFQFKQFTNICRTQRSGDLKICALSHFSLLKSQFKIYFAGL